MKRARWLVAALTALSAGAGQAKGVDKLYILNCGEGGRRRHFALVARRQRRQVDAVRGQLLSDQA
ncbi:MAG TPA: hypothetical protein VF904_17715 [Anaeromyxobacteraceae bacterium]